MTSTGEQEYKPGAAPAVRSDTVFDVTTQRLAKVYAEALYGAASRRGETESTLEEFESLINDLFGADAQLEALLTGGAIGRKRRAEIIQNVFGSRASEILVNTLQVLNDHERLDLLRPFVKALRELHDERSGRIRVQVRSATAMPLDQQERLKQEVRTTFRKEPQLVMDVDPSLLGGMVLRIGDWVYDHSVSSRLENLRKQLIARSSHEIQSGRDRFSSADGN